MSDDEFLELCRSCDARKVEEAIMNGANVNAKRKSGRTALMSAANEGRTDVAEVLVKHGADVNAKNNDGRTALDIAQRERHSNIVKLLRKYGAK